MPNQPKQRQPRRKSALRLTIGRRLALAVIVAGLLAVAAAMALGVRSLQLMRQQSTVYQRLIAANADLASGEYYLQLLQDKLNQAVNDAQASGSEPAMLTSDTVSVQQLENQYNLTLANYLQFDMFGDHPPGRSSYSPGRIRSSPSRNSVSSRRAQRTRGRRMRAQSIPSFKTCKTTNYPTRRLR